MLLTSHFSLRRMVIVCRSLAVACDAGIPLKRCFTLTCERSKSAKLKRVMTAVSDAIASGLTLEQALRAQSRHFPPLFIEALSAAEVGGSLAEIFRYLADYYEEWQKLRRSLHRQLAYPLAVLFAAWFLFPIVHAYLAEAGGVLPKVLGYSSLTDFWVAHGAYVLRFGIRMAVWIAILAVLTRLGVTRRVWDVVSLYVWPLAPMMRRLNLALFLQAISVLLRAGLDLPEAIERSARLVPNRLMGKHLMRPLPLIESGATFIEAFASVPWLPPTVREMLAIAEQSGTLPETLAQTSKALHTEGMHPLYVLVTLVEAISIVAVASMIF